MTDTPGGLPPAGWYPDPYGAPHERWWDGAQWTEHTTPPPVAEPVQPTHQAPAEPAQQSEPVQQSKPVQQSEPIQQSEPVQQEQPAQQGYPSQQAQPVQQEQPAQQYSPFEQRAVQEPVAQLSEDTSARQEPDYPEYESTFEATQQQPSPSWGAPVSAGPAAAAKPAPSFDELFGNQPTNEPASPESTTPSPTATSEQFFSRAATTDSAATSQQFAAPAAESDFDSLFGGSTQGHDTASTSAQNFDAVGAQPAADPFAGVPASGQSPFGQQSYPSSSGTPAAKDAAFDFSMIVSGAAAPGQSAGGGAGAAGDSFSTWSNEDYVDPPRNPAATASVAFGVLSFVIVGLGGLLGIVFGAIGLLRANRFAADGDGPVGRTKSVVGIALSVIGTIVSVALVLFVIPGIINPTSNAAGGNGGDDASSIVAATASTPNGGIALADGELATITFPDTADPSIQFSITGITVDPTCTEDPELVLSPNNGQFIAVTMTFTTAADYASQLSTGGLLLVSPTDFVGYLPDGTSVNGSDAGLSCVPEAEQLPDGIPAGATTTATMILDMSPTATSITYSPVGVTGLDTSQTFWEWSIPR